MKESLRFPLVLTLVCLGAALGVSGIYTLTRGRIAERRASGQEQARLMVSPKGAADFIPTSRDPEADDIFKAVDADGETLGYVVGSEARGYAGPVVVMVGFDRELRIVRVVVTAHTETPGLGAELAKVKTTRTIWGLLGLDKSKVECKCWLDRFRGMPGKDTDPEAGNVDAKTGATITSNAITDAVHLAYQKLEKHLAAAKGSSRAGEQ